MAILRPQNVGFELGDPKFVYPWDILQYLEIILIYFLEIFRVNPLSLGHIKAQKCWIFELGDPNLDYAWDICNI